MMERCRLDYHPSYQNRERPGVPSGAAPGVVVATGSRCVLDPVATAPGSDTLRCLKRVVAETIIYEAPWD